MTTASKESDFRPPANMSPDEALKRHEDYVRYEQVRITLANILISEKAQKVLSIENIFDHNGKVIAIISRTPDQAPDTQVENLGLIFSFIAPADELTPTESIYTVLLYPNSNDYAEGSPPAKRAIGINDYSDPRASGGEWLQKQMPIDVLENAVTRFQNGFEVAKLFGLN